MDVDAEIDLEHVLVLQHCDNDAASDSQQTYTLATYTLASNAVIQPTRCVATVRRVVRGDMIPAQSSREADAALHAVLLDERARAVLDQVGNLDHRHARLDRLACVRAHLSMHLGRAADRVVVERGPAGGIVSEVLALLGAHLL